MNGEQKLKAIAVIAIALMFVGAVWAGAYDATHKCGKMPVSAKGAE